METSGTSAKPRRPWRWWFFRVSLVVGVLLVGGGATLWLLRPQPDEVIAITCQIDGQPRSVTVDCFYPEGKGALSKPLPMVAILHGVEGATKYQLLHHANARRIAREGYAVYFVHYFDTSDYPTISVYNDAGQVDTTEVDRCIECDRQRWVETAAQTLQHLANRPEVDRNHIGLLGYSLGCFVSISTAERAIVGDHGVRVAAVVGNWGAMFSDAKFGADYPPIRMFHGGKDSVVKCQHALDTAAHLKGLGKDCELIVYPEQGHILRGEAGDDAARRTLAFLAEKLQRAR